MNKMIMLLLGLSLLLVFTSCKEQDVNKQTGTQETKKPIQMPEKTSPPPVAANQDSLPPQLSQLSETELQKVDPALKLKFGELAANKDLSNLFQISGKFSNISAEEMKKVITDAGGTPQTVLTNIFTAECPDTAIVLLVKNPNIEYIELAKKSTIKPN